MTAPALSRTACAFAVHDLIRLLREGRFNLTTENHTQYEIARLLAQTWPDLPVSREHRLGPRDRPDFLIAESVVLEVKGPRHRAGPTLSQLERYAGYPQVDCVILATSRAMAMPATLDKGEGVRIGLAVINLGRAWL